MSASGGGQSRGHIDLDVIAFVKNTGADISHQAIYIPKNSVVKDRNFREEHGRLLNTCRKNGADYFRYIRIRQFRQLYGKSSYSVLGDWMNLCMKCHRAYLEILGID